MRRLGHDEGHVGVGDVTDENTAQDVGEAVAFASEEGGRDVTTRKEPREGPDLCDVRLERL